MTNQYRHDVAEKLKSRARYLAPGDEATAKQQAYIFRDLLKKHCQFSLKKSDLTDVFSLLFHGMKWADLMARKRGEPDGAYYAMNSRSLIGLQARQLSELLDGLKGPAVRVFCDMPMPRYLEARTLEGAKLATAIAGAPSWTLPDISLAEGRGSLVVSDADTGMSGHVLWFSSDPMTNDERLAVLDMETSEVRYIPIQDVVFSLGAVDLDTVRDPAERWSPAMKRVRTLLPEAERGFAEYDRCLDGLADVESADAQRYLEDAIEERNRVMMKVVEAYWLDTREVNSREAIFQTYGTKDPRKDLCKMDLHTMKKLIQQRSV